MISLLHEKIHRFAEMARIHVLSMIEKVQCAENKKGSTKVFNLDIYFEIYEL